MGYYPAKMIRPGLWIGSEGDSQDPAFMAKNNIGLVVNASKTIPFLDQTNVEKYRVPVDDTPRDNAVMYSHFPVAVVTIDSVLRRGKGVLVHCRAGMQRSATVVAAYLMYKYGLSAKDAMAAIKGTKTETFWPVPTFKVALLKYQTDLRAATGGNNHHHRA
jgi:dual specificity MAP kinase phosphatase